MVKKGEVLLWPAKVGLLTAAKLGSHTLRLFGFDSGERFGKSLEASQDRKELALSAREIIEEGLEKPKVLIMALRGQNKSAAKIAIRGYLDEFETGKPISDERKLSVKVVMTDHMPKGTTFESLGYEEVERAVLCPAFPEFCAENQQVQETTKEAVVPQAYPEEPSTSQLEVPAQDQETRELKLF
jgi:hypothetical protein